jgi:hypothetical protein
MLALHIDLLKFKDKLQIKSVEGIRLVFDSIRRKWIPFSSEEFVRQLFIHYLVNDRGYPKKWISIEKGIRINGIYRRYDLAVYNKDMHPQILIECKSPTLTITQDAFDQILHYNMKMNVPFLVVTNGVKSHCCTIDMAKKGLVFLDEIPKYNP